MNAGPARAGWPWTAALVVAAAIPLHVALALGTDLSPDEAYYLCAARRGGSTGSRAIIRCSPTRWQRSTVR